MVTTTSVAAAKVTATSVASLGRLEAATARVPAAERSAPTKAVRLVPASKHVETA